MPLCLGAVGTPAHLPAIVRVQAMRKFGPQLAGSCDLLVSATHALECRCMAHYRFWQPAVLGQCKLT